MMRVLTVLACVALTGCAAGQAESQGQQADDAACTAQADATYNAQDMDQSGRAAQPGLIYGATPTHVFDAEQLGGMHQRDSSISNCERNGNAGGGPSVDGGPVVVPHIVGN